MIMMKQKDAVYNAIKNVVDFEDGAKVELTKDERASVSDILIEGFSEAKISYDGEVPQGPKLSSYVSGLLSNWLRKDTRLNGGVKYEAKNPGSRAGVTDAQIKAMRLLLSTKTDPSERAEIQTFIDARLAVIKPAKTVTLNVDDLPAELRAKLGM